MFFRSFRLYVVVILLAASLAAFAGDAEKGQWSIVPAPREDAWWQDRYAKMNEQVKQKDFDLAFIGDSITHGWETTGKKVWDKYYAKRKAINLGIGGDRVEHVLWRLDHGNIEGISPKLAVLMIGTNNVTDRWSPGKIAKGVELIVQKLRKKLPETKLLVLAIFPRETDKDAPRRHVITKANEIISQTLADDDMVVYMDIGEKFLRPDGTLGKDIMPDLLHPNEKGYEIWAEAIEPTVARLMREGGGEPVNDSE